MDKAMGAFTPIYEFIHHGFNDVRTNILAIVIVLVVAFALMKSWGQLLAMTILATVVHLLAIAVVLPLVSGKTPVMPDLMAKDYWMTALSLAVGYLIMLIVLFFLKKNVFKMGGSGR